MRSVVALAALLIVIAPAYADTTAQNLAKYHRLRQRLVTDFVSVGTAPGQSEPAPERTDGAGLMKWGDGTIALGFYLGVLATEQYMLANPAQFPGADDGDPSRLASTREELYDALLALERLDTVADASFPSPCTTTPALNGFFVRDDVPADFYSHFPGITTIQSDFVDPTLTNKEESQDQVYHVQHGLALVVALVPASVVVHGKPLRAWAIEQAQRITQHYAHGDWVIRNPACGNRTVNRGSNTIGYSFGETLAATFVTDGGYVPTTDLLWSTVWDTLRQPANPTYSNESNLHMALAIMAVGDGYQADTPQVIATLAASQDWWLYPLLHRVLHPNAVGFCTTAPDVNAHVRAMLDELPSDGEPACPGPNGPAPHGFTTHNRFIRGKAQAYVGPPGCEGIRYHGLDYMLLHNLYAIATPGTWNGSPSADPCAPVVGDGAPATGDDGGINGDAGIDPTSSPAGCGCRSTEPGATWPLFVIAVAWSVRRRRIRGR
ncbi:MAG TPA: MYXO-CTERM sorting domain-containing protein [Kofleriaceae bacterium]|nr:MYXO-CTERM sorting domain-containing protein [Kofleriaceae bacterium]